MDPDKFAAAKIALLSSDVDLQPHHVDAAWARFQQRSAALRTTGRRKQFALIAAGLALAAVLATPSARAWAQTLWTWFVLRQAQPLPLDMEATSLPLLMPNVFPLVPYGESQRPSTLAEAEQLTGFHIFTLDSPSLPYKPGFRIEQQTEVTRTIDMSAIRAELARLGRPPVAEPSGIDGATIVLRPQGKLVVTSYGNCPQIKGIWRACAFLVQSRPKLLELSPGVDWKSFTRFSLHLAGVSPGLAETLIAFAGPSPTMFLPNEKGATLQSVNVRGHQGILVRYADRPTFVLEWQEPEFHFELHGRDADHALEIAATLR